VIAGAGNVISGNESAGVQILNEATVNDASLIASNPIFSTPQVAMGNVLEGNLIGTDAVGTGRLANEQGVFINDASQNVIGGGIAAAANVISGNTTVGVQILGDNASRNAIVGNVIGTDRSETIDLGNGTGVVLYAQPTNFVDLSSSPTGNVVKFNASAGIQVRALSEGPVIDRSLVLSANGQVTGMLVFFDMYLAIGPAQNLNNYQVTILGASRAVSSRVAVSSATYDGLYRFVLLAFANPVPLSATIQLRVIGTSPGGVTDRLGNFLDGTPTFPRVNSGTDYVATFRQGVQVQSVSPTPTPTPTSVNPGGTRRQHRQVKAHAVSKQGVDALAVRNALPSGRGPKRTR
jgi:hypothetical protein